jgi:hypothetical protein
MKTLVFSILTLFLCGLAVMPDPLFLWELEASYKNLPPSGDYRVWIRSVRDVNDNPITLFDRYFNPVPAADAAYGQFESNVVRFNAVYSDAGNPSGTNGLVYYGKYEVQFREYHTTGPQIGQLKRVVAAGFIDFRDSDYGYPDGDHDPYQGVGNPQDFFVHYDFGTILPIDTGQTQPTNLPTGLYFKYGDSTRIGSSFGIWELLEYAARITKPQNISRFKNYALRLSNEQEIVPLNMKINGAIFPMDHNTQLQLALGFQGTNVVAIAPTQAFFVPGWHCFKPYYYFSRWEGGALFDTVATNYITDLAVSKKAIYKPSS